MSSVKIGRFTYDSEDARGLCPTHRTPIFNAPVALNNLNLTDQEKSDALAGLWGVAWCPVGKHYQDWTLPAFDRRTNATEDNPLGQQ